MKRRLLLLLLQLAEPMQLVLFGGSQMAWVRWTGEINHRFVHLQFLLGSDRETFEKWESLVLRKGR